MERAINYNRLQNGGNAANIFFLKSRIVWYASYVQKEARTQCERQIMNKVFCIIPQQSLSLHYFYEM